MTRSHFIALLLLAAAIPAAAAGAGHFFARAESACFAAGSIGYRFATGPSADITIHIDNAAARPDLTLQLVDDPAVADFVLADGVEAADRCRSVAAIRSITVDPRSTDPDMTITLAPAGRAGALKIYAHSSDFTAQDAAALFAVMWNGGRRHTAAR